MGDIVSLDKIQSTVNLKIPKNSVDFNSNIGKYLLTVEFYFHDNHNSHFNFVFFFSVMRFPLKIQSEVRNPSISTLLTSGNSRRKMYFP